MKQFSSETRQKMSDSAKRRCADPTWLERQYARGTKLDRDVVQRMYNDGCTQAEIGKQLGVSQKVVWNFMRRHGIKARVAAKRNQHGEKNSSWKGGKTTDGRGYVMVRCPHHPRASKCGGYVAEHILAAENQLCRPLYWNGASDPSSEVVHHIDGNPGNNDPANLLVLTVAEHSKLHWLIRKYGECAGGKGKHDEKRL